MTAGRAEHQSTPSNEREHPIDAGRAKLGPYLPTAGCKTVEVCKVSGCDGGCDPNLPRGYRSAGSAPVVPCHSVCPCIDPENCNDLRCGGEELHGYRCRKAASEFDVPRTVHFPAVLARCENCGLHERKPEGGADKVVNIHRTEET